MAQTFADVRDSCLFRLNRTAPLSWLLLSFALLRSASAAADAGTGSAAQALFEQARALMAQGRVGEACPKLEESQRLDPAVGTLLNLARCYELAGRFASAWNGYLEAASAARLAGNSAREREAQKRADGLRPKLSYLVIDVSPEARSVPELQVMRDGKLVGAPQWGSAIPCDAGEHTITASANGYEAWTGAVTVKPKASTVSISIPPLRAKPAEPAAPVVAVATAPTSAPQPAHESPGLGTQKTLALVAGGVGVVSLGVATIFGVRSANQHSELEKYCEGTICSDQRGVDAGERAYSAGNVATAFSIVGGVGIAAGVALWLTAPQPSSLGARLKIGPGSAHLVGVW